MLDSARLNDIHYLVTSAWSIMANLNMRAMSIVDSVRLINNEKVYYLAKAKALCKITSILIPDKRTFTWLETLNSNFSFRWSVLFD